MPEFSLMEWTHCITVPSTVQKGRLEDLLRKSGIQFTSVKGKIYTNQSPGIATETMKGLGAKVRQIKKPRNRTQMPPVQCTYGNGCKFKSADMDELANHIRGHYGDADSPQGNRPHILEVQVIGREEEPMTTRMKGRTEGGKKVGKLTQAEVEKLKTMVQNEAQESFILANFPDRRPQAIQKWIGFLKENPEGKQGNKGPETGDLSEGQLPEGQELSNGTKPPGQVPTVSPGVRVSNNPRSGPVTSTYTILGLIKRAHRQMEELQETLDEVQQILGPFLQAQENLLDRPANKDWR